MDVVGAFAKRISCVALHCESHIAAGLLMVVKGLFNRYAGLRGLLEVEEGTGGAREDLDNVDPQLSRALA